MRLLYPKYSSWGLKTGLEGMKCGLLGTKIISEIIDITLFGHFGLLFHKLYKNQVKG